MFVAENRIQKIQGGGFQGKFRQASAGQRPLDGLSASFVTSIFARNVAVCPGPWFQIMCVRFNKDAKCLHFGWNFGPKYRGGDHYDRFMPIFRVYRYSAWKMKTQEGGILRSTPPSPPLYRARCVPAPHNHNNCPQLFTRRIALYFTNQRERGGD